MTIDISQFFQVFYEETEEHLAAMESLLLALDIARPDPGQLNAIFRAAHSIKGSAGTFGFKDLAEVTHVLEHLLDRIRRGELLLREDMIDAFLAAGDLLKVLLAAHKGQGEAPVGAADAMCARLSALSAPQAPPEEEAYGFFEPQPEAPAGEEEAYGFFDEPPVSPGPPSPMAAVQPPAGEASIRVGVAKVDEMINLVGELVITQAMLVEAATGLDPVRHERLLDGLAQFERNTRNLQEAVMSIRMMPMATVFSRFPRVVRELSQKLGKRVELRTSGDDTELDKGLIERIVDPLTHLVRNSLDHGIESAAERRAAGKPEAGVITMKAFHQGGNVVIEVGDDGAGLSRPRILAKARERGLPADDRMTDAEVWQLIFEPGFSTAEKVTEISGRGVGMDVVKQNIGALGGRVEIQSAAGSGTCTVVRLPLTLAIIDGMSVAAGPETYVAPLGYVIESLQPEPEMVERRSGAGTLVLVREERLPMVALHEVFGVPDAVTAPEQAIVVVVESDGVRAALLVDAVGGQQPFVVKSLEANYRKVAGISGATIMGDGRVALILDVPALVRMACSALPAAA